MGNAAVVETPRPSLKEVTKLPEDTGITRQDIRQALGNAGVPDEGEGLGVTPPMEKPVLTANLAKEVGAVNVGHEELKFESEQRDARNFFKVIRSYFTGESIWGRLGATGRKWIGILKRRKVKEASVQKGDPNALNVGE